MTDSATPTAAYESKAEAEQTDATFVKMWLDALGRAEAEEKEWRDKAEKAIKAYRGDEKAASRNFNIFHSNIETLCPALYNSTPAPDVRRRFADPDPVGKAVADILERALAFSVDCYDFDALMKTVIRDGEIAGRGVARVRYEPTFAPDGLVAYEQATCDYVPWRYFRRGPGRTWKDVPWVAFGDFLDKEQIAALAPALADRVPLNYTADAKESGRKSGTEEASIFRRALVWQIWDKDHRRVISIAPDYSESALAMVPDPLGLAGFFPVPRPYQPVVAPDSLEPVVPFEIYADLVAELNEVTARIARLVRQLRPRGGYGGNVDDIKAITEADDGELVPLTGVEHLVDGGGIDKWIAWFPLAPTVGALNQLVQQREQIKQTIYEVTGIADILRGASRASETATAQQIKTQWGSLRIQDRQAEVARLARDLFRLKAEIIAQKFSWETLSQMTGIALPSDAERALARQLLQQASMPQGAMPQGVPGAPPASPPPVPDQVRKAAASVTREEAEALLRSDVLRLYRIDVESDSTIRGDLTRNQHTMTLFLQGTAQFAGAMAPIVQQAPGMLQPVMEIYAAFARNFKLGRQAEDALDALADAARQAGAQPQPPKPDPKAEADKARAAAAMAKSQMDLQARQAEHAMTMQELAAEQEIKSQDLALAAERRRRKAADAGPAPSSPLSSPWR
jgi:hypothetical protein